MTKEELVKEAEELIQRFEMANSMNCFMQLTPDRKQIGEMLVMIAEPREKQIEILSKHILELQADKGRLTDKVRELEDKLDNCLFNYTELERRYKSRCDKFNELDNLYERLILKNKELEQQLNDWQVKADYLSGRSKEK